MNSTVVIEQSPNVVEVNSGGPQGSPGPQGPSVSDGDKGDVVVSGGSAVWTIDPALLTAFMRGVTAAASEAAFKAAVNLEIGVDVQAYDADLAAIAGLTSAADRLAYFTGSGTAALATFTAAGRALMDDADATAQRATLGLVIGTNVQAYDADLTTWGGKTAPSGTVVGTTDTQTLSNKAITGVATNSNAAAGDIGEFISSQVLPGSAVALTTTVTANVTSISLTAGDWDVFGSVWFSPAGTTSVTGFDGSTSTVSATQAGGASGAGFARRQAATVPGANNFGEPCGVQRLSLSATTTVYLVATGIFSVSTLAAFGFIRARRVR